MSIGKITLITLAVLVTAVLGYLLYTILIVNPRVERDLLENPAGDRAKRAMLLTLPSGKRIPVNHWRNEGLVYAAADGTWWKELRGAGGPVTVVIQGETITGIGRAIEDDPGRTEEVFAGLRPNAIKGFGTLIEITPGADAKASQ